MRLYYVLLVLLATLAASAPASAQTVVRDSVQMEIKIYEHYFDEGRRCRFGIYAVWPNVLQDILGSPDRAYGYGDYTLVATEGQTVQRMAGEMPQENGVNAIIPDGFLGHNAAIGANVGIQSCGEAYGNIAPYASGAWGLLNGNPFRITEWYATFSVPDGTPIALFEWEPGDALAIDFDASFESEQSREVDASVPGNKVPVASYAWAFGDGTTGTGARPTHTYDEPGEYAVRLTVTDDDGETASREEMVTVDGVFLRTEIEFSTDEVAQGDTITVRGTVTNGGTETIFGVRAQRQFLWSSRVDEALNTPGSVASAPRLIQVPVPDGEDEVVTASSLEPGASIEVTRRYRVNNLGTYRTSLAEPARFEDAFVDWKAIIGVEGETPEIDQVAVRQPCQEADPACATTLVSPPKYTITVVSGSGPRASTGLTPGALREDIQFVSYADVDGGTRPICENGCADVVARVLDEDGEPVDNFQIRFTIGQTGGPPYADAAGGFVCERVLIGESGRCVNQGAPLDVRTDEEGLARAWVALKAGPPDGAPGEIEVDARPTATTDNGDPATLEIPIDQTVIFRNEGHRVSAESALFLGSTHLISTVAGTVSLGNWCESYVNWVRDQSFDAFSLTRYQRNSLLMGGAAQVGPWICSVAITVLGATSPVGAALALLDFVADATKKVVDIYQYTWFAQEYGIDKPSDLIVLQTPLPPPLVAWLQGDVVGVADQVAAFAFTQGFAGTGQNVILQEVSGLQRPSGATEEGDFDPSRYDGLLRLQWEGPSVLTSSPEVESFMTFGYTPVQNEIVSIGSEGFLVGNGSLTGGAARRETADARGRAASPRVGEVAEPATAGTATLLVGAWSGEAGEYVVVGDGTATPEMVQVRTVTPDGTLTTLALTTPLRYAHASGDVVERIAPGTVAPPVPPALRPAVGQPSELAWVVMPSHLASAFDVEVVTDTTAASEVLSAVGLTADSLVVDAALFTEGVDYFWRVRASNEVGAGVWSPWLAFLPPRSVDSESGGPEAVPTAFALGAPYPNPARSASVTVSVDLPMSDMVRLAVYDALGREVAVAHDGPLAAGRHPMSLDTSRLPAGVYVVRLVADADAAVQRLTVVR